MKLRSIYHTSKGERGIGKWIVRWTWFLALFYNWKALKYNYSHEELWIPDEDGKFGLPWARLSGQCFSSTTRGGAKGVRFAPASEVLKHPERWKYIEFEVDAYCWKSLVLPKLQSMVGNKYDFVAVATGFITPFLIDDKKKNYCSGICCMVKYWLVILKKQWKIVSPRRSAMLLVPHWGEPKRI